VAWTEIIWGSYGGNLRDFIGVTRNTPLWILLMIFWGSAVLNTGISIILFFFSGKKLNQLSNQLLNYLSVCGSLVGAIVLALVQHDWAFFATFPFVMLLAITDDTVSSGGDGTISTILIFIMAALPSLITWFGMLYKSKKQTCS